jgi:hypothetical protein
LVVRATVPAWRTCSTWRRWRSGRHCGSLSCERAACSSLRALDMCLLIWLASPDRNRSNGAPSRWGRCREIVRSGPGLFIFGVDGEWSGTLPAMRRAISAATGGALIMDSKSKPGWGSWLVLAC